MNNKKLNNVNPFVIKSMQYWANQIFEKMEMPIKEKADEMHKYIEDILLHNRQIPGMLLERERFFALKALKISDNFRFQFKTYYVEYFLRSDYPVACDGKIDWLGLNKNHAGVLDWKFGYKRYFPMDQLMFYAYLVINNFPEIKTVDLCAVNPRFDSDIKILECGRNEILNWVEKTPYFQNRFRVSPSKLNDE